MAFIAPAVPAIVAATAIGTTAATLSQQAKTRKAAKEERMAESLALNEAQTKERLLESKVQRTRQRQTSGSGQNTILSGSSGSQAEVNRNVLLGQ